VKPQRRNSTVGENFDFFDSQAEKISQFNDQEGHHTTLHFLRCRKLFSTNKCVRHCNITKVCI